MPISCTICNVECNGVLDLKDHVEVVHNDNKDSLNLGEMAYSGNSGLHGGKQDEKEGVGEVVKILKLKETIPSKYAFLVICQILKQIEPSNSVTELCN